MKVCVIGLGYVGLTLAIYVAKKGFEVYGIDISDDIINSLKKEHAHFFEEGFDTELKLAIKNKKFSFGKDFIDFSNNKVIYILTLGTPITSEKSINLKPIKDFCNKLAKHLKDNDVVILRSTLGIGCTREIVKPILDSSKTKYQLAFCPERTIEGAAFQELSKLPQIISGIDDESLKQAKLFFNKISCETILLKKVEEAEITKLLNNSERDLMFALANEVALMCDSKGLNAFDVINAANFKYPRSNIKKPGLVGGPCLEKDPFILTEGFTYDDYSPLLFKLSRLINEDVVKITLKKIFQVIEKKLNSRPKKIAILGFAFKGLPLTGDLRGSPVYKIIHSIRAYDKEIVIFGHDYITTMEEINSTGVKACKNISEATDNADLIILQNNHPNYSKEHWNELEKNFGKGKVILDFWNQLNGKNRPIASDYLNFGNTGISREEL